LKSIFLVILLVSSVSGFLNHKAYAAGTTDGTVASSTKIASGTAGGPTLANGDRFGSAVAEIGDVNGDRATDIAVGAPFDDTGGTDRGAVYIMIMSGSTVKIASGTHGGPTLANGDLFGFSVANIGDFTSDEVTDIAVGAFADDTGGTSAMANRGAVYLSYLTAIITKSAGRCTDCTPPSIRYFTSLRDVHDGFAINGNYVSLARYSLTQNMETFIVDVANPVSFTLRIFDDISPEQVYFAGLYFSKDYFQDKSDSKSYIQYNLEGNLTEIVDKIGLFSDVKVSQRVEEMFPDGPEVAVVTFDVMFARELPQSNIIVDIWDKNRNPETTLLNNVIEVVQIKPFTTTPLIKYDATKSQKEIEIAKQEEKRIQEAEQARIDAINLKIKRLEHEKQIIEKALETSRQEMEQAIANSKEKILELKARIDPSQADYSSYMYAEQKTSEYKKMVMEKTEIEKQKTLLAFREQRSDLYNGFIMLDKTDTHQFLTKELKADLYNVFIMLPEQPAHTDNTDLIEEMQKVKQSMHQKIADDLKEADMKVLEKEQKEIEIAKQEEKRIQNTKKFMEDIFVKLWSY
jgi:hypothetical protein